MKKQKSVNKKSEKNGAATVMDAANARSAARFEVVAHGSITPSLTNPRKSFPHGPLQELADSIRVHGIKQPLLVRPLPKWTLKEPDMVTKTWRTFKDGVLDTDYPDVPLSERLAKLQVENGNEFAFELVCGERRYRAAKLAERLDVPVMIENLDDKAVLEIQLIENDQREDLNVMDRARGYQKLRDELGYTESDIIEKTGKGRSTVYEILSLLKASQAVQDAINNGSVHETVGRLLAKIPGEKNQAKALKEVLTGGSQVHDPDKEQWVTEPMSYRKALEHIRRNYTLALRDAKFDRDFAYMPGFGLKYRDAGGNITQDPLPALPTCEQCPKRSGNCKEEFPELKDPNICTDPTCFGLKTKLHTERIVAKAKETAAVVITGKEAQKAFDYYGQPRFDAGYVSRETVFPGMKKTVGQLLKSNMPEPVIAIVNDKPKKIFTREAVEAALKEAGHKVKTPTTGNLEDHFAEAKAEENRKLKVAVAKEALPILVKKACKKMGAVELLRLLAQKQMDFYDYCDERNISDLEWAKQLAKMPEQELIEVIYEAQILADITYHNGEFSDTFVKACKEHKVDLKEIGNELKLEFKEANKLPKDGEEITMERARLEAGGDIGDSASAAEIIEGKIRKPFEFRGRLWVSTGGCSSGAEGVISTSAYQVVPKAEYKGDVFSYGQMESGTGYAGVMVAFNKEEFVLAAPKITFVPDKPLEKKKTTATKKKGAKAKK